MKIKIIDYSEFDNYGELVGNTYEVLDTVIRYKIKDDNGKIYWINSKHCQELKYKCPHCNAIMFQLDTPIMGRSLLCQDCGRLYDAIDCASEE